MNGEFTELSKSISILDRLTKMYYNHGLSKASIGWGQLFYIEYIYDHSGATAQEMVDLICVDKATVTKVIKRLLALDYIKIIKDKRDRRVRHLYLTEKAIPIAERIKQIHFSFYQIMSKNIKAEELDETVKTLNKIIANINQKVWHRMEALDGE